MTRVVRITRMATRLLILAGAIVASLAAPAWGHGDVRSTDPKENDALSAPPKEVSVTLTEAPTDDAVIRVMDGCHDQVVEAVAVKGDTISASLKDPHPGHFRVQWKAISSVDGHPTDGRFFFHVTGKPKCHQGNQNGGHGDNSDAGDHGGAGDDSAAPPTDTGDETGSSFPFLPVGLGAVAIVGIALFARRAGAR